ncbi:HlyD family secretion protein [Acinetobacter larvae]|uniref:AprE-like beta-barrel domain-containing protein n=1 Tax=Acinetobacter larvae TaxID=1789224 RepID=A0A1B2M0U3_9GAMM|nr:HlyD family secretion protein [Acinetobacter larvae]AOA58817.1 hypothetical protein BFG52_10960 [Acinetobacter larvae]
MSKPLFRKKAVDAQKSKWIGEVILIRPFSFAVLTLCVGVISCAITLFLFFGSYTKRTTVQGQLMPNTGLVRVFTTDGGIVDKKFIEDGQHVNKGDPLYAVRMTRYSSAGNYNASVEQQIQLKRETLDIEKDKLKDMHRNNYEQMLAEISALKLEVDKVHTLIQQQRQRLALAQQNVNRYQELRNKDYISVEEFQLKQDTYLNQKLSLQSYERDLISKKSELENKQILLKSLSSKLDNDLAGVDRQIAANQQESIENNARDQLIIKANASGLVTSSNAQIGQQINPSTALLNIVPDGSILEAHLYIPSSAIGFIKVNQPVKLRFQAYPYQKFGQAQGKITAISATTVNPQELSTIGELPSTLHSNEPVYVVKVHLNQQNMYAYGEKKALKVGMVFDADILQETRKLYEWVLEPLYSITGKL